MGVTVSKHSTQLFIPFTLYLSDIFDAVKSWRAKIMVLHPEMAHCNYDTYRDCAADIWEKTNEYFGRLHDLNVTLAQQTSTPKPTWAIKPSDKHDSGLGSSTDSPMMQTHGTPSGSMPMTPTGENNPFLEEVISIMKDVKASVGMYVQAMRKVEAKHLGRVKVMAFLGHIFSTGLNFQTSMWQLVMTEAIYLPTMMREHLHRETETL